MIDGTTNGITFDGEGQARSRRVLRNPPLGRRPMTRCHISGRRANQLPFFKHSPSVLIPGFVIDTRNVATTAAGSPGHREREKRPTGPLGRAHPQPPPPKSTNASRHPRQGLGSHMIPAPVRSVSQTDGWCLQLLTSMQRGCDTDNPFVTKRPVAAGAGSGRVWRSRDCNGPVTQANQRLGTLGAAPARSG